MQPEGGSNWLVGVVRRFLKLANLQARVGIQTVSRQPLALEFSVEGGREVGVLLQSSETGEAQVILRPEGYIPEQNLEVERDGRLYIYLPRGISESGDDYVIARYREMVRED